MSGIGQSEEGVASTSGMMETSMMEGEEYYNPGDTSTWTQKEMSEQLCRICSKPNQYLIPIFEGEGIEHQLESKIQKHLPIEVLETDELPLQVCYQCASTLIAWNDLVIACIEADKKLRQLFQHHEDQDDKGAEFFDEPILDSDEGEEPTHQSTSPATVISDSQTEILSTKRSPGKAKKSKLQTALLKSSTAGPSGHKPLSKKTVVSSQDDAVQEGTERFDEPPGSYKDENHLKTANSVSDVVTSQVPNANPWTSRPTFVNVAVLSDKLKTERVDDDDNLKQNFRCNICSEVFDSYIYLAVHERTHSRLATLKCPACQEHFSSKVGLKIHFQVTHEEDNSTLAANKRYQCDICDRMLKSKHKLMDHRRTHTGERPFTCHVCGKQFAGNAGLWRHVKAVHECIKDCVCDICGKAYKTNRDLNDHRRSHTGETPFVCDVCGKAYRCSSTLYIHKKSHSDEKPFPCPHCDKKFKRSSHMVIHTRRAHTFEKPYVCEVCTKCFVSHSELWKHKMVHSDQEPFACTQCGMRFRVKRYLVSHDKTHHKQEK